MKVKILNEEPYGDLICSHMLQEFPSVSIMNDCELVEALSRLIVGTKEVRYGCLPSPEALVVLRKTIRNAIESNVPIPILVPWGSIKANFSASIDIAEVSAIQRVITLSHQIKEYYSVGAEVVIRVEDTSGYTLFTLEGDQEMIKANIDSYSRDMVTLVKTLDPSNVVRVQLESEMKHAENFNDSFNFIQPLIQQYLNDSSTLIQFAPDKVEELSSFQKLKELGWRGVISLEQRSHYMSAYSKLYSDWNESQLIKRLSLYFAGAWARHTLQMTGKQSYWNNGFIQLAFIPPIKGLPEGYNYNYVYYRTLPLSEARTHISPWRAKGYFKINGNELQYKLTSFNDIELIAQLTPVKLVITNEEKNTIVIISTDYLLES